MDCSGKTPFGSGKERDHVETVRLNLERSPAAIKLDNFLPHNLDWRFNAQRIPDGCFDSCLPAAPTVGEIEPVRGYRM